MTYQTLFGPGGATELKQDDVINALAAILNELQQKIESGEEISLSAGTIAALQAVTGDWLTNAELRATPVPVSFEGATVDVGNLQQLAVVPSLTETGYDLQAAAYSGLASFTTDSLLGSLVLQFSSAEARDISVVRSDGSVLWETAGDTSLQVVVDFEDDEIDSGMNISVGVTQTTGACLLTVALLSKIGTSALGGNPVLGEGTSYIGQVGLETSDSPAVDAFRRMRVSSPRTLLDAVHTYDLSPFFFDTSGNVTHLPNESAALLTANDANPLSVFQTHRHYRYQPGKSLLAIFTLLLGAPTPGIVKRVGFFDDNNGVFLEQDGDEVDSLAWVIRSSTSGTPMDTAVRQASWNRDSLDGNGSSGITIDPTKVQLTGFDLQWLSIGRVRTFFEINDLTLWSHFFRHANLLSTPYMSTAFLPFRNEIRQTTPGATGTLKTICATIMAEGGHDDILVSHTVSNGAGERQVDNVGAVLPVLSVRPKTTFKGIANRGYAKLTRWEASSDVLVYVEVVRNGTLTGASWVDRGTNSLLEYDVSATGITGGEVVTGGYVQGAKQGAFAEQGIDLELLTIALGLSGTKDTISLVFKRMNANADVSGLMELSEVYS